MVPSPTIELHQHLERGYSANEARIAEQTNPPKFDLDTAELLELRRFAQWCAGKGLRHLPAKPATVGAWIANESAAGVSVERIEDSLRAIEIAHTNQNLANPVCCPAPRNELQKIIGTEGPRSWKKSERLLFASLPPEIRSVISRRARQDELTLRRLQNEVAALRKKD